MSRHYYDEGKFTIVLGSDRPLKNVFMDIMDKDDSESDDFLYDSMTQNGNYFKEKDIRFYAKVAKDKFDIDIPEEILQSIEMEMRELKNSEFEVFTGKEIDPVTGKEIEPDLSEEVK